MSFNVTTDLSTIFLNNSDSLGVNELNKKFDVLLDNDKVINRLFFAPIGIWQCLWYYDSNVRGYSIGDAVWLNTEEPISFVKSRSKIIKQYTDANPNVLTKLPEFDATDDAVIRQYYSAMSGYADPALGKDIVLPPIFDIGDYSKPIQLAVSLKDNNKDLTSDKNSWRTLFVDSDEDFLKIEELVDEFSKSKMDEHLSAYHLLGHEENVGAKLSDYVDMPAESPSYASLPLSWYLSLKEGDSTDYGVDYVTHSIRKPYLDGNETAQYQSVRYWHSGIVEHFGTIATSNQLFVNEDGSELVVPFDWNIANDGSGAVTYVDGKLAVDLLGILSANETDSAMVPPKDGLINVVYEKRDFSVEGSFRARPFADDGYALTLHPIYQDLSGIAADFVPISYGEEAFEQNWNANYLTNEVLSRKNGRFFTMKLKTRVVPPFISYYAVGKGAHIYG